MKTKTILFTSLITLFILAACQPTAEYDIRGDWEYIMTSTDGNIYDDGTISFSGSQSSGTYLEVNIYEVEYDGEYQVNGAVLTLTGDETWQGTMADADHISGTWQHEDGFSGTFMAVRKTP